MILEQTLESISIHLDIEPSHLLKHIQTLPKPQDLTDLQAKVDCLLKENGELKMKVEEGEALRKEMGELKDWIAALEEEVKTAQADRDKAKEVVIKIHSFLGFLGDVLNKARLYNQGLRLPETASGAKMIRCMVDYSAKMEKTLKALRELLHPTRSQLEPPATSTPIPVPDLVPIPTPSPGFITPPVSQLDPLLQEAILEINTEDIASLRTWAEGGSENFSTPTGTGTTLPGTLSTPGTVNQEA